MTKEQLEKIAEEHLVDTEDHDCANWESIEVLWMIYNNFSWRASFFTAQGFTVDDVEQLKFEKDAHVPYFDLNDEKEVEIWERLAIWLRDVVFNKEKLDLSIHSMTVWNYGDEGGPALVIALLDKENNDRVLNSNSFWEQMTGENFPHKIAGGLGVELAKKVYYIYTFVM